MDMQTEKRLASIESKLERLETIVEKVLKLAETHPMGKTVLKMLGL